MIVHHLNRQSREAVAPWRQLLDRVLPQAFAQSEFAAQCKRRGLILQVNVVYAGPRIMKNLNRDTRQVDEITDVLSFPLLRMHDGKLLEPLQDHDFDLSLAPRRIVPLGDIVLSLDQARRQAAQYRHSVQREVAFLSVHGLLHLLGYDHQQASQEALMIETQRKVLESMNLFKSKGDAHERQGT